MHEWQFFYYVHYPGSWNDRITRLARNLIFSFRLFYIQILHYTFLRSSLTQPCSLDSFSYVKGLTLEVKFSLYVDIYQLFLVLHIKVPMSPIWELITLENNHHITPDFSALGWVERNFSVSSAGPCCGGRDIFFQGGMCWLMNTLCRWLHCHPLQAFSYWQKATHSKPHPFLKWYMSNDLSIGVIAISVQWMITLISHFIFRASLEIS
jgi:hypothetical protein